jgi:hypothetical protein
MIILFHFLFLILIAYLAFVVYKAWFKDWAQRHYNAVDRYFPIFTRYQKKHFYLTTYKISVATAFVVIIALYIFFILFIFPQI